MPAKHRVEAEQIGAIGILMALEKFRASPPTRGRTFRAEVVRCVKYELALWLKTWAPKGSEVEGKLQVLLATLSAADRKRLLAAKRERRAA